MNKFLEDYDLFCFDFDGLLVDSEPLHQAAYDRALSNFNLSSDVDFLTYCGFAHNQNGSRLKTLYQSLFSTLDDKLWNTVLKTKQKQYSEIIHSEPLALMPGAEDLIQKLLNANKSLCVVTNSKRRHTEPFRRAFPILDEITLWVTKEDVAKTKPHPDGYLNALVHYAEVRKDRAIGLDDALKGITAIKNAGIQALLVCDSHHPQLENIKPDLKQISSLLDLF